MQLMPPAMQHSAPSSGVKRKHDELLHDQQQPVYPALVHDSSSTGGARTNQQNDNSYAGGARTDQHQQQPGRQPVGGADSLDVEALCCPLCLKSFMCKYGLDTHFQSHEADAPTCRLCRLTLPSVKLVYVHYFIMHVDRSKLSEFASQYNKPLNGVAPAALAQGFHDLTFTDFSIEKFAHIAKVWCEKNWRRSNSVFHDFHCRRCDHAFPSADVLRMHLEMHPDVCDVTCQSCDVTFASKQEFEDHVIQHSSEKVIESFSALIGADDNDVQDLISQPEFLLCLGLKAKSSSSDWCNNNAIERDARKYEQQISGAPPPTSKPVNHVQPIVIQPQAEPQVVTPSVMTSAVAPSPQRASKSRKQHHLLNTHPAFQSAFYSSLLKQHLPQAPAAAAREAVEISSSSDGEGDADMENVDKTRPYQCVICEFAFTSLNACEYHCR